MMAHRSAAVLAVIMLVGGAPEATAGVFDGGIPRQPPPAPAETGPVAPVCLRFATTGRGLTLVNLCGSCRRAAVSQALNSRRSATTRYLIAPRSALPLPGPKIGSLRIVADLPC